MPLNGNGAPGAPPQTQPPMKKSTRNWLLIGGLGLAGFAVYYAMRSKSSSSASAADLAAQGIDPTTNMPYSQEYGGYGTAGVSPSLYGYVDPSTGAFISGAGAGVIGPSTVIAPSTNASWAQQVEAYLSNLGYDPQAVGNAIGKYLSGQTLSSDQQGIVAAALGFFGPPPTTVPPVTTTPPTGQGPSKFKGNRFLLASGAARDWVRRKLGLRSGASLLGTKWFTSSGQPTALARKRLG
jgi:hypothetical protein